MIGRIHEYQEFVAGICECVYVLSLILQDGVGLAADSLTGYKDNQFNSNNGGNTNPQVSGGIEIGTNVCGGDTTCP